MYFGDNHVDSKYVLNFSQVSLLGRIFGIMAQKIFQPSCILSLLTDRASMMNGKHDE